MRSRDIARIFHRNPPRKTEVATPFANIAEAQASGEVAPGRYEPLLEDTASGDKNGATAPRAPPPAYAA